MLFMLATLELAMLRLTILALLLFLLGTLELAMLRLNIVGLTL